MINILTQPSLHFVEGFDASLSYTFTFSTYGGNQVVANRLVIKNNSTLVEVYNEKIAGLALLHTVPADTLTNGVTYQATVTTYDNEDNASTPSSAIVFSCIETPVLSFSNIVANQVINSPSYTFEAESTQDRDGFEFELQNAVGQPIARKYPTGKYSATFDGFATGTSYRIRFFDSAEPSVSIVVPFSVSYVSPETQVSFDVEPICDRGVVEVDSYIHPIYSEYSGDADAPTYVDNNTAIALGENETVSFEGGIDLQENYQIALVNRGSDQDLGYLVLWTDKNHTLFLIMQKETSRLKFVITTLWDEFPVHVESNYIPTPLSTDNLLINIFCKNGEYSCTIINKGGAI